MTRLGSHILGHRLNRSYLSQFLNVNHNITTALKQVAQYTVIVTDNIYICKSLFI